MAAPTDFARLEVARALQTFSREWVSHGWSWDSHLECVASTFALGLADEARQVVARTFPLVLTHDTIAAAPALIRSMAERTGGVRPDQFIAARESTDRVTAYALWWPWGGEGSNISLRVGLVGSIDSGDEFALRNLFNALS